MERERERDIYCLAWLMPHYCLHVVTLVARLAVARPKIRIVKPYASHFHTFKNSDGVREEKVPIMLRNHR
jgi:hypothetical protein